MLTAKDSFEQTRKIQKYPGLSFLFIAAQITSMVLFYPITISLFEFYVQKTGKSKGDDDILRLDRQIVPNGQWLHILLIVIFSLIWVCSLIMQITNILFTTELSTRRIISWSVVQPYGRIVFFLLKIVQAVFLTLIVFLLHTRNIRKLHH